MRQRQGFLVKLLLLGSVVSLGLVWLFHTRLFSGRSSSLPSETFTQHLAAAGKVGEGEVNAMLRQFGPALAAELRRGKQVDLPGLGSFQLIERPEYQALDRTTGQMVLTPAGCGVVFVPEQTFVTELNSKEPPPEPAPPPAPLATPVQPPYPDPAGSSTTSWARP